MNRTAPLARHRRASLSDTLQAGRSHALRDRIGVAATDDFQPTWFAPAPGHERAFAPTQFVERRRFPRQPHASLGHLLEQPSLPASLSITTGTVAATASVTASSTASAPAAASADLTARLAARPESRRVATTPAATSPRPMRCLSASAPRAASTCAGSRTGSGSGGAGFAFAGGASFGPRLGAHAPLALRALFSMNASGDDSGFEPEGFESGAAPGLLGFFGRIERALDRLLPSPLGTIVALFVCVSLAMAVMSALLPLLDLR